MLGHDLQNLFQKVFTEITEITTHILNVLSVIAAPYTTNQQWRNLLFLSRMNLLDFADIIRYSGRDSFNKSALLARRNIFCTEKWELFKSFTLNIPFRAD